MVSKVLALVLVFSSTLLVSCGQEKDKKPSDKKATQQVGSVDGNKSTASSLLGKWRSCEVVDENSVEMISEFKADGKLTGFGRIYKDKGCSTVFSEEEVKKVIDDGIKFYVEFENKSQEEATKLAEKDYAFYRGTSLESAYSVGQKLASGETELNILSPEENTYTVYKIEGNELIVAGTCTEIDEESGCKAITGDKPENRAKDFQNKTTYRVKRVSN